MKVLVRVLASLGIALSLAGCTANAATTGSTSLNRVLDASDWLNGRPTAADVRGKVVVLDFYTFECYNCKNVEPNLRALYKNYPRTELAILSVHSPETQLEHNRNALVESLSVADAADLRPAWRLAQDRRRRFAGRCGQLDDQAAARGESVTAAYWSAATEGC